MEFVKSHGAGNDYVLVDARRMERDWSAVARAVSDRHFGIGSDGLILLLPSTQAELRMRIFNPDGSEAEMCGNGIRCLAKFAIERGVVAWQGVPLRVETLAGIRTVEPVMAGGRVARVKVGMGEPVLRPQEIPVDAAARLVQVGAHHVTGQRQGTKGQEYFAGGDHFALDWPLAVEGVEFKVTCVSMGNPHAVAFVEQPVEEIPLHRLGPQVEHHPMFPRRTNFEVVNLVDRGHLRARVWERGAGQTLACGTGACAIAVAAHLHGYIGPTVDITLDGGVLTVQWAGRGEVFLEGPAEEAFTGVWPEQ
ncbi:MAG: diaminopimelate epimerase [Chloroflexi bacterium]|nr:diaminopimelate epimerase [Chloroflexota bacterium]